MPEGSQREVFVMALRAACHVLRVRIKFKGIGLSSCECEGQVFGFPCFCKTEHQMQSGGGDCSLHHSADCHACGQALAHYGFTCEAPKVGH